MASKAGGTPIAAREHVRRASLSSLILNGQGQIVIPYFYDALRLKQPQSIESADEERSIGSANENLQRPAAERRR
jgi:hypothetical protein